MATRSDLRAKFSATDFSAVDVESRKALLRHRRRVISHPRTCMEVRNSARAYYSEYATRACAMYGFRSLLTTLLDRGAPIDARTVTEAVKNGRLGMVRLLLDRGAPIDTLAMSWAAYYGHEATVRLLLDRGAPIISRVIAEAAKNGHEATVRLLLDYQAPIDERAIEWAAKYGRLDTLRLLIDRGAPRKII